MNKYIKIAGILGALAVGIGAFGAHALKDYLLESNRLDTFETAVQYHFYHVLALFAIGILSNYKTNNWLNLAANFMIMGIILFSGSLYVLCLMKLPILGVITPFGGLALIAGWLMILIAATKKA